MTEAVLRLDRVSKWYGQVIGLNDVTVDVPPGVTGLLGPNGAGKSTLLKLATGLIRPSQGRVTLLGQVPWNNPHLLGRIGLAPEHDTFYDRMTGLQFVRMLARMSGLSYGRADRAARAALEQVELTPHLHRRIGAYSKGMRQRAKLAQCLVHDPDVLFLDEPLTGTDPVGRRQLIDLIRSLGKKGKTILVSSHVLHEVEAITHNILLIAKGRIVAEGDLHRIRELIDEHPHHVRFEVDLPRALAQNLVGFPGVVSVRILSDHVLEVETRTPDEFYTQAVKLIDRDHVNVISMTSPDDDLQAVFKYLVG